MAKELYQQGDVLIERTDRIRGKRLTHLVLAKGEATGHCHEVTQGNAILYEDDGNLFLQVGDKATVTHQEHKPPVIPQGNYEVRIVREYDHFAEEAREVKD